MVLSGSTITGFSAAAKADKLQKTVCFLNADFVDANKAVVSHEGCLSSVFRDHKGPRVGLGSWRFVALAALNDYEQECLWSLPVASQALLLPSFRAPN